MTIKEIVSTNSISMTVGAWDRKRFTPEAQRTRRLHRELLVISDDFSMDAILENDNVEVN